MLLALIAINFLTLLVLVAVIYLSFLERQKLLDRIMAKNYDQYTNSQEKPEENDFSDGQENFIDLDQAKKEITE